MNTRLSRPLWSSLHSIAHRQTCHLHQPLHTPISFHIQSRHATILSSLSDTPGAYKKSIRRGRGPNNKGRTAGRGSGGQKARGRVPAGFQGGQKSYEEVHGTHGFENENAEDLAKLNLDRLQSWVDQGRINPYRPITVRELVGSGCITRLGDGVKLLARGSEVLKTPLHIYVSRASRTAIEAIENAGGTVTTRYYSPFALAKIMAGEMHPIHSRLFRQTAISKLYAPEDTQFKYALPDPTRRKYLEYYRDIAVRGYLSYMVKPGETHSLYWGMPGREIQGRSGKESKVERKEELLW